MKSWSDPCWLYWALELMVSDKIRELSMEVEQDALEEY